MNEFRFRHLEKYKLGGTDSEMQLSVPPPLSPSGKVYKECPNQDCSPRLFQLGKASEGATISGSNRPLISRESVVDGTTCPYCGHAGESLEFVTCEALEAIVERAGYSVHRYVHDMSTDPSRFFCILNS